MRLWQIVGWSLAATGLMACDAIDKLLPGSPTPAASASATASAPLPAGDWKPTEAFDGRWRVIDSSGHRDGGFAFHPHLGGVVVIEGGVMAFLSQATGQQSQIRKTLRVAGSSGEGSQRVLVEHRGHFYDHDPMTASAESVDATSKGWSRHGIARVEGEAILLAVTPLSEAPPTSFEKLPEVAEVVRLAKSDAASEAREAAAAAAADEGDDGGGGDEGDGEALPEAPPRMPLTATLSFEARGACPKEPCPDYVVTLRGDGRMTLEGESIGPEPRVTRVPFQRVHAIWFQLYRDEFFTTTDPPEPPSEARDGDLTATWGDSSRRLEAARFPKARTMAEMLANVDALGKPEP